MKADSKKWKNLQAINIFYELNRLFSNKRITYITFNNIILFLI